MSVVPFELTATAWTNLGATPLFVQHQGQGATFVRPAASAPEDLNAAGIIYRDEPGRLGESIISEPGKQVWARAFSGQTRMVAMPITAISGGGSTPAPVDGLLDFSTPTGTALGVALGLF